MTRVLILVSLTATVAGYNNTTTNQAKKSIPYSAPPTSRTSKDAPTAIEVAQVLKMRNVFPKENTVVEKPLNDVDKKEGALTSVNIASFNVAGYTVKVYQSSDKRNQARLRMIKECPGCNVLVECGAILMYEPVSRARDLNQIAQEHARERGEILKRYFHCQ